MLHMEAKDPEVIAVSEHVLKSSRTTKGVHEKSNDESNKSVNGAM